DVRRCTRDTPINRSLPDTSALAPTAEKVVGAVFGARDLVDDRLRQTAHGGKTESQAKRQIVPQRLSRGPLRLAYVRRQCRHHRPVGKEKAVEAIAEVDAVVIARADGGSRRARTRARQTSDASIPTAAR